MRTKDSSSLSIRSAQSTRSPKSPLKTFVVLASVTVLYTLYRYEGSADFFLTYLNRSPVFMIAQARAFYFQRSMALLLLGIVPMLIIRIGFKERLSEYGLLMKRPIVVFLLALLGVLVVTPLTYFGSRRPEMAAIYPQVQNAGESPLLFFQSSFFSFLFYVGYEFCFRGFLFMGIKEDVGVWQALGVSLLASVLLHMTQPQPEMVLSILPGIIFPLLVWKMQSIWPGVLIHAYIGVSIDYWIIMNKGGFSIAGIIP